jgi:V8-like Glu-specific endopeptidase
VRNTITEVKAEVVHYLTDTQQGSSGAPVFDSAGKIVALHHSGGSPVSVVGKPPLCKNEGILIARVVSRLVANHVAFGG